MANSIQVFSEVLKSMKKHLDISQDVQCIEGEHQDLPKWHQFCPNEVI